MIDCIQIFKNKALLTNYDKILNVYPNKYILITLHRPGNVDNLNKLLEISKDIINLSEKYKIVFPIHPRTKTNLIKLNILDNMDKIIICEPLGYLEFLCLTIKSKYVITDSGGVQEETTALNIPCFTLRENTERPSTLIENGGTNILIKNINEIEKFKNIKYKKNNDNYNFASENILNIIKSIL